LEKIRNKKLNLNFSKYYNDLYKNFNFQKSYLNNTEQNFVKEILGSIKLNKEISEKEITN
jgi:hypothetical protein